MDCVFCEIVAGKSPASVFYEDDECIGFMGIRPIWPGECMVIPKAHIDHFTDINDDLMSKIMLLGKRVGHRMLEVLDPAPKRVGYVVHGFGVPHAHLIIVPQHEHDDIVSGRHLKIENNQIVADETVNPLVPREELNEMAERLRINKND